jgi:hypothetical protein
MKQFELNLIKVGDVIQLDCFVTVTSKDRFGQIVMDICKTDPRELLIVLSLEKICDYRQINFIFLTKDGIRRAFINQDCLVLYKIVSRGVL